MIHVKSDNQERLVSRAELSYNRLVDGRGRLLANWGRGWSDPLGETRAVGLEAESGDLELAFIALDGETVVQERCYPALRLRSSGDLTTAYLDDLTGVAIASSTITGTWRLLEGPVRVDCVRIVFDGLARPQADLGTRSRLSPLAK